MNTRPAGMWWGLAAVVVAGLIFVPLVLLSDDGAAAGYEGYIQGGTCAQPSDGFRADLESEEDAYDVEPYDAVGSDGESVTLGYYGAPGVPGFGLGGIYTDEQFSLVIADPDSDEAVACGDVLRPDADEFGEAGLAVVQLLPVGSSEVEGLAAIQRTTLERELDITPTQVRIILSTEPVSVPADEAAGYDGYLQGGQCESPQGELRVELTNQDDDYAVTPYKALPADASDPVTVAYHGGPGAPGFGLAATNTDQDYSLVISDAEGEPAACGDILEPAAEEFTEAGLALVQLQPTGDAGVQGYAVLDRVAMEREVDITPMLVRVLLFAPPAD